MMRQSALILAMSMVGMTGALDIEFDSIHCDADLPAYVEQDGIVMKCNGNSRCTFGEQATISGEIIYNGLQDYNLQNTSAYVSGNLKLMTMEYDLFQFLPFNFCGDWIMNAAYNYQTCPSDGTYHFELPYSLPESEGISAWFATGWEGVSYIKIYKGAKTQSALLAKCKLHFKTYVTDNGAENWYALPSAAQTTVVLFSVLGFLFMIVMCLACRRQERKAKHPVEDDYDFKAMNDDTEAGDEESSSPEESIPEEEARKEKARKMALQMNYKN